MTSSAQVAASGSADERRDQIHGFVRDHRSEWVDAGELVRWIRAQFGPAPFPGRGDLQALCLAGRLERRCTRKNTEKHWDYSFRAPEPGSEDVP